jgi:hypothetical protein
MPFIQLPKTGTKVAENLTPWSLVDNFRCFGGTYAYSFIVQGYLFLPWSCRRQRRYIHTKLHDVTRKINFSVTASVARHLAPCAVHHLTIHHTWKVYTTAQQEQMFVLSCLYTDTRLSNFTNGLTFWGPTVTLSAIWLCHKTYYYSAHNTDPYLIQH